jgi:cation diffusion facilitator CzcD-associated flavoprotein CzcO
VERNSRDKASRCVNYPTPISTETAIITLAFYQSVLVIGAANTAFDVIEDCHDAGLTTTMVQRSPTYIIPFDYILHPQGLGIFDHVPAEIGDAITQAGPLAVGGPILGALHAKLAAAEP